MTENINVDFFRNHGYEVFKNVTLLELINSARECLSATLSEQLAITYKEESCVFISDEDHLGKVLHVSECV